MLVYLDTSAVGRVLDDYTRAPEAPPRQAQRGRASHAAGGLLSLIESGFLEAVTSSHTLRELRAAPGGSKLAARIRQMPVKRANVVKRDITRAIALARRNLSAPDALHAAIAERIGADVVLTTDKGFLAGAMTSSTVRVQDLFEWMRDEWPKEKEGVRWSRKRPR